MLAAAAVLVAVQLARAADPEQKCQQGRYKAAAKYVSCEQKALGKWFANNFIVVQTLLSRCQGSYTATWDKLVAKAAGSTTCVGDRFVDNRDGTVTDGLTALQWEQKTDDGSAHDKDNMYSWSAGGGGFTAADGTAFTSFLSGLNSGCFAGQCDWRLPTLAELQTILSQPYPCATSPCVDEGKFGPTAAAYYWSSTAAGSPFAWYVFFDNGNVSAIGKSDPYYYARAVRGGL